MIVPSLRVIRRALTAIGVAAAVAAALRLRAVEPLEPQAGNWRELSGPDFR